MGYQRTGWQCLTMPMDEIKYFRSSLKGDKNRKYSQMRKRKWWKWRNVGRGSSTPKTSIKRFPTQDWGTLDNLWGTSRKVSSTSIQEIPKALSFLTKMVINPYSFFFFDKSNQPLFYCKIREVMRDFTNYSLQWI